MYIPTCQNTYIFTYLPGKILNKNVGYASWSINRFRPLVLPGSASDLGYHHHFSSRTTMSFTRLWRNAPLMTFSDLGRIWELTVWAYFGCQNWRHILCLKTFDCRDTEVPLGLRTSFCGCGSVSLWKRGLAAHADVSRSMEPQWTQIFMQQHTGLQMKSSEICLQEQEKREQTIQTREKYSTLKKSPENAQKNNFRLFF